VRAGPLSDKKVVALLNSYFVPVYASNDDLSADNPGHRWIIIEAKRAGFAAGTVCDYICSADGKVIDALNVPAASMPDRMAAQLKAIVKKLGTKKGQPLVKPTPQSRPPKTEPGALVLHLTARYLPAGGTWRRLPAEDWIVLDRPEWEKLLPTAEPRKGLSWELDKAVGAKLLKHFYPPTENNDLATDRIDRQSLKATIVALEKGVARARIDGSLKLQHSFNGRGGKGASVVEATLVGYLDFEPGKHHVKSLRLVTDQATYLIGSFGVAVRSAP
jgi:hypothetical protein